jgi:N-acetylglucosaminyl-diphospho-decaprenol L-rhamnosyltransferase
MRPAVAQSLRVIPLGNRPAAEKRIASISRPCVTVSIVSHGQLDLIAPLLTQLEAHCAATVAKIILTINIPEPRSRDQFALRIPLQRLVNDTPSGFGANHNRAFDACQTDWFLVLNPDVRLESDVIGALVGMAEPETGVMAPRVFEPGKLEPEPHRALLTPWEVIMRQRKGYVAPRAPAWIPGLFMLFRSRTYCGVNGFDPRYFMYAEDFDICARLRLAGWKILIAADLAILHDARRSVHKDIRHLRWFLVSVMKVWASAAFWRIWRQNNGRTGDPRTFGPKIEASNLETP